MYTAEIPVDQMTKEQREGYRFLVEGPRGRLPGPYKVWVHNPKLVHAAALIHDDSVDRSARDTSDDTMMLTMKTEAILMPSGRSKMFVTVV